MIANARYLPEISEMGKADLVAVCDIVEERADRAAQEHGVPHAYYALDEMLAEEEFDLLVNTTHIQASRPTSWPCRQGAMSTPRRR